MAASTLQLKNPGVCRVFFSSPFNGMEGEREELTRIYFPQIQSFCNKHGVQFVAVDMRWGITSEQGANADVINVCLRELDRSDLFVGFFGQRYGWHGSHDQLLQTNFTKATAKYPWVDSYRDRSVTELEFLHGHLNDPGRLPAVIAFRKKAFDDERKAAAEKDGNQKEVSKYVCESEGAVDKFIDLRHRVSESRSKLLGLLVDYETPEKGAEFMFNAFWPVLQQMVSESASSSVSYVGMEAPLHDAFLRSRVGLYFGGEQYQQQLDSLLDSGEGESLPLMIIGGVGTGKSALIANTIHRWKSERKDWMVAYHFIGCSSHSNNENVLVGRLIDCLNERLVSKEEDAKLVTERERSSLAVLSSEFQHCVKRLTEQNRRCVILVDELEKLDKRAKTFQPLAWLPSPIPSNMKFIFTCHLDTVAAYSEEINLAQLRMEPLSRETTQRMTVEVLKEEKSKELSKPQLDKIINADRATNPLFLKVLLNELCVMGYFRLLDSKIDQLVECKSVEELFNQTLQRLEKEYNPPERKDNMVRDVMCSLVLSSTGLSEFEITSMLQIQATDWLPLFYAVEKFLNNRNNLINVAYSDLSAAVKKRYLFDENVARGIYTRMSDFLFARYKREIDSMSPAPFISRRHYTELPFVTMKAGLRERLIYVITDIDLVEYIRAMALYELMEYWNYLNLAEEDIARHLIRSVERHLARRYARAYDGFGDLKVAPLTQLQLLVCDFMLSDCGFTAARETLLLYAVQMAANTKDETARLGTLYHLGILYFDMMKLDDSERCYEEVIECSSKRAAESQDMLEQLARCCNAMGLLKKLRREYDEARRYLQLSKEHHSKRAVGIHGVKVDLAITWMNIGACYFDEGFNEDALENLEKAKELYDECFFGTMTHDKLSVWNNMAICYRRMGRLDDALKLQQKCLEGRLDMFGHKHPDVVESYMNIAVVYQVKEQYEYALELNKKALDLATTLFPPHHLRVSQLQENMALILYIMGRVDESEEWLFKAADAMTTAGTWASCLITLHGKFISSYINEQNDGKLLKLLVPLMQTKYVQGGHYNLLDVTRKRLGLEAIPGAEDLTLEHGLQRFPGNESILGYMTATLADEGKLDEMRRFLLKEQRQPSLFASLCNNYFQDARVHEVLVSAWLSQHPDDPAALAQADVVAQRTAQSEASSDK